MRVLIVDDHEPVRKALRRLFTAERWDVCGEAADGPEVLDAVRRLRPDVIVMDLFMPAMSGMDAGKAVLAEFPSIAIVLLTTPDPEIVDAARAAGFRGTVSKAAGNLVDTIRTMVTDSGV